MHCTRSGSEMGKEPVAPLLPEAGSTPPSENTWYLALTDSARHSACAAVGLRGATGHARDGTG